MASAAPVIAYVSAPADGGAGVGTGAASPRAIPPGTGKGLGVAPVDAHPERAIGAAAPTRSRHDRTTAATGPFRGPRQEPLTVTSQGVYSFAALTPLQPIGHNGRKPRIADQDGTDPPSQRVVRATQDRPL